MADPQIAPESQSLEKPNFRKLFGGLLPAIIISGVFPPVILVLASPHMPLLPALALAIVPVILYSGYSWVRTHSIDPISITVLFSLVVAVLLTLFVHDPHLFLIRESYVLGAFGPLCLISLLFLRPVAFYVARYIYAQTPEQIAYYNAAWQVPYFRFANRLTAVVWGLAFIGEMLTDTFLVYHLPIAPFLVIHQFLYYGTILATMGWAALYGMRARKRWGPALEKLEKEKAEKVRSEENKQTVQATTR
jgi:hypothetical protein